MRIKGKEKKKKGINIEVSQEAHAKMLSDALKITPRRTLRAHVNIINKLSPEL